MCVGKIALFDKALASALARGALAMCAMRVGFSFFFCGWEKNKINSSNLHCPVKKLNSFYFQFITIVSVWSSVALTLVANSQSCTGAYISHLFSLIMCIYLPILAGYIHVHIISQIKVINRILKFIKRIF